MKKIVTAIAGVVIVCALSGCVTESLKTEQQKERLSLRHKQQADREVARAEVEFDVSAAMTAMAADKLEKAKKKQKQVDADFQSILCPPLDVSF